MPETSKKNETEDDGVVRDLKVYIENRLKLFAITISEQISAVIAISIQKIMALLLALAGMLILWMALGFYIGGLVGNTSLGFLIAASPLLLLGIVLYNFRFTFIEEKIQADILNKMPFDLDENDGREELQTQNRSDHN